MLEELKKIVNSVVNINFIIFLYRYFNTDIFHNYCNHINNNVMVIYNIFDNILRNKTK